MAFIDQTFVVDLLKIVCIIGGVFLSLIISPIDLVGMNIFEKEGR